MKLSELQISPDTMEALDKLVLARLQNFGLRIKGGEAPMAIILGEMTILETKIDALMHLLEDKQNVSFKMFDAYMGQIAGKGFKTEEVMQKEMLKPKGPQIVKQDGSPL